MIKNILLAVFTAFFSTSLCLAQSVTTLAGTPGTEGYNSTSTTFSSALFTSPDGIVVDAYDRVWITESGTSHRVRVLDPAGSTTVITKTGSGLDPNNSGNYGYINQTGIVSRYQMPKGICIDKDGYFYIADRDNHAIRKATPITTNVAAGQTVSTFAGIGPGTGSSGDYVNGTGTAARFFDPVALCSDANGNIYVADQGNECVRKITPSGVVSHLAGSNNGSTGDIDGAAASARFNYLTAIALLDDNHVVVCDGFNNKIKKINIYTGEVSTLTGKGPSNAAHKDGNLAEAEFHYPTGIAVDANGNIYVSEGQDGQSNVIRIITATTVKTLAGKYQSSPMFANGIGDVARFSKPISIAFNGSKNELFVTDQGNAVIRKIDLKPITDFVANPTVTNVGLNVNLVDKTINSPSTWTWNITPANFTWENGTNANSQNPRIKFTQAGTYTVSLTASNVYGSNTATKNSYISVSNIQANAKPGTNFDANKLTPMVGETVVFTDKSNENPLVWEWGFSPATVQYVNGTDKNSQNPQIQFLSAGKYTVLLKAGNSKGDSIHVKLNYINVQPVGITAIYKETLRVYPNPSNGKFTIEIPGNFASESNSIQIMDVAGKVVFTQNGLANNTIALNGITKGIYFIKLITAQGLFTEKIVVQ